MNIAQMDNNDLFQQRRQAVSVWLKFVGMLLLGLSFVISLVASVYSLGGNPPPYITLLEYALEQRLLMLAVLWVGFALMAISFYGLLRGHYAGLISCLVLSYLVLADAVYRFATTGMLDLSMLISLILITLLHKTFRHWRLLEQTGAQQVPG
ncbi:hypothetical protein QWY20_11040 [Alkalimonas sp. MEB108]|uniref:DUF2127 domain-containing protein n=1 Tax=Alkalimonas cellulosilytica TaxID=3058395 RepID=A0ABU7J649_9GAMM|nr:hypothetical protein [Alkalimonas sp. MEB108]MEE2001988.1 hypothetical protein [Alkalimonas sp. MEB108]